MEFTQFIDDDTQPVDAQIVEYKPKPKLHKFERTFKPVNGFKTGNPGKPKGAQDKTTRTAKEAIALAAEGLGGVKRLIEWCREDPVNERIFWGVIYPKLLPLQVNGEDVRALIVTWQNEAS